MGQAELIEAGVTLTREELAQALSVERFELTCLDELIIALLKLRVMSSL